MRSHRTIIACTCLSAVHGPYTGWILWVSPANPFQQLCSNRVPITVKSHTLQPNVIAGGNTLVTKTLGYSQGRVDGKRRGKSELEPHLGRLPQQGINHFNSDPHLPRRRPDFCHTLYPTCRNLNVFLHTCLLILSAVYVTTSKHVYRLLALIQFDMLVIQLLTAYILISNVSNQHKQHSFTLEKRGARSGVRHLRNSSNIHIHPGIKTVTSHHSSDTYGGMEPCATLQNIPHRNLRIPEYRKHT